MNFVTMSGVLESDQHGHRHWCARLALAVLSLRGVRFQLFADADAPREIAASPAPGWSATTWPERRRARRRRAVTQAGPVTPSTAAR